VRHKLIIAAVVATFFLSAVGGATGQDQQIQFSSLPSEIYHASEIVWRGHFGGRKVEPHNIYCLMTQGSFLADTSRDWEDLIKNWLAEHTKADVRVVYVLSPALTDFPDSKMKSVWVVDGDDFLNLYLVRKGGCSAQTMLLNRGDKTSLAQAEYESFVKKVVDAENQAKKEKLGIWSGGAAPRSTF
jgi:hypothetical protein